MGTVSTVLRDTVEQVVIDGAATLAGEIDGAAGQPIPGLVFSTGLATAPSVLPRRFLGLMAPLLVPPGACAVIHLPGGERRTYGSGSHMLWNRTPGPTLVQWVDMRRRQVPIGPVEGWSADKWRVRLWLIVEVEVADPAVVAAHREPLMALAAAVRASVLRSIEQQTHAALTGCAGDGTGGLDALADMLAARLRADPGLGGLHIVSVRVVERQGDERQIEAMTAATVAAAQVDETMRVVAAHHRAKLQELAIQEIESEREHTLRIAAASAAARERLLEQQVAVQAATLASQLEIVLAQIRAQTDEIGRDEQRWQAEQARLQGEWEMLQRQHVMTQITDQRIRLLEAQGALRRGEADEGLVVQEREQAFALALAETHARLADQQAAKAEALAERQARHEQTLAELALRHEQLVAEQLQRLEQWRMQTNQIEVREQRQHDRHLAAIAGTARIAAAAALPTVEATPPAERQAVANAGLRALQSLAEPGTGEADSAPHDA